MTQLRTEVGYDVAAVRAQFPALREGAAHFDGPGGSQIPASVARRIHDTLVAPTSNRGTTTPAQRNADEAVAGGRAAIADLLGVEPAGVVFGRSATQNTFDMARTIAKDWGPGDEVVVTRLDHDSNVRPWLLAAASAGATVRWADFDPATGELDPAHVEAVLSDRTRVVALTAASNLIGTVPDVAAIAEVVHAAGAWLYVDGVHYAAHAPVDVAALGADFFACSPYKFLGPHCGALYGRPDILEQLTPDKLLRSTDAIPERFELGTLPYELLAGTSAAVDFLAGLRPDPDQPGATRRERLVASMSAYRDYETLLRHEVEELLMELPGATLHSRAKVRTSTLLVTFDGHDSARVSQHLAEHGVNAPAGVFYCHEASRLLGLGDAGGLRVGLAPYSNSADVHRVGEALSSWFDVATRRD
jgi:cysteine desulfurase family protein (TIGR01976 family)